MRRPITFVVWLVEIAANWSYGLLFGVTAMVILRQRGGVSRGTGE